MSPLSPIPPSPPPARRPVPLGWIPTWIVGRRYYDTTPPPDTDLPCERQPDNLSDPDAIAVYAPHGGQVGHLPRYDAACLAPLVDRGAVRLTARLSAGDDPHNRAPVRLEVWADTDFTPDLLGPDAKTAAALWHTQLLLLWQSRGQYAHTALEAFRTQIRDLAHSGALWPETQLLYRLLKGTVADGAAEEARARERAAQLAAEAEARRLAAEQAAVRDAFACQPAGDLLSFGHLRLLPLSALRPVTVTPLTQALRAGDAALTLKGAASGTHAFEVLLAEGRRVLALAGERLDTTAGLWRVAKDALITPADTPFSLPVVPDGIPSADRRVPVFLRGAEQAEPALPALPPEATGFAIFRGGELLHVNLFAHPLSAQAALDALRRMSWHLTPAVPPLDAAAAAARVAHILANVRFSRQSTDLFTFGHQPGVLKGRAALPGLALAYLRLSINDTEFDTPTE